MDRHGGVVAVVVARLSARRPRRVYSVRQQGVTLAVYRATREAVRATWRRDRLDVRAMDEAAHEALRALWLAVEEHWLVKVV